MTTTTIKIILEVAEAEALAQFVKRVGFDEIRQNAQNDEEAYAIREAINKLQTALDFAGYSPR